jgi:hypothetical protein
MPTAPSSDNLLLGKGSVYFDRFDTNGNPTGLLHLGNVETFELTTEDDNVDKYSSMTASAPLYSRVNRRRTATLKIVGNEFPPDNLALVLMGTVNTLTQVATGVTDEPVWAATHAGGYFTTKQLGPISAVTVKFGATSGVLGTDYAIINATAGLIRVLPGTVLTGAVTVSYTPTAYTSTTSPKVIAGGISGTVSGKIVFIGDPTKGPKMMVEVWHANITPDGAVGLISDDYANLGLSAAVLDDSSNSDHVSFPLYKVTYLP